MPEGKRVRRTPQQMAQDLDAQMEKLNASREKDRQCRCV